jgi:hypothetical protein
VPVILVPSRRCSEQKTEWWKGRTVYPLHRSQCRHLNNTGIWSISVLLIRPDANVSCDTHTSCINRSALYLRERLVAFTVGH